MIKVMVLVENLEDLLWIVTWSFMGNCGIFGGQIRADYPLDFCFAKIHLAPEKADYPWVFASRKPFRLQKGIA